MKITTLEDLLVDELKDIYSAENQLIKALPKMAKAAEAEDLRNAFEHHLEQTRTHAKRIEQICSDLNIKPGGKKCMGMQGLIEEGSIEGALPEEGSAEEENDSAPGSAKNPA